MVTKVTKLDLPDGAHWEIAVYDSEPLIRWIQHTEPTPEDVKKAEGLAKRQELAAAHRAMVIARGLLPSQRGGDA